MTPSVTCTSCGLSQPSASVVLGVMVTFTCTGCGRTSRDLVHEPTIRRP